MRLIVAQIGARRNYAVPAILEKAGMLEHFYTDMTGDIGIGKWLANCGALLNANGALARLASRRLPETVRAKTSTFATPTLRHACRNLLTARSASAAFREHLRWSNDLGHSMVRRGYGQATHIFSMLGECGPLLLEAKRRGLTVVSEVYILLSAERIVAEERRVFPGWEPPQRDLNGIRAKFPDENLLLTHSDFAICPSEAVRHDLTANFGFPQGRTSVVSYGVNPKWLELESRPQPGRILFVGTAELRKGIHYLALAAEQLAGRGRKYEFRVAGSVSSK